MSNRAAHRRIRLFLHAGDDGSGCQRNSRRPLYGHVRHRPFPNGRELSRVPTLSAAGTRTDARVTTPGGRGPAPPAGLYGIAAVAVTSPPTADWRCPAPLGRP